MVKKFKLMIVALCLGILFGGCGHVNFKNHKADDDLTKAVYEAAGKDIYYIYKEEESDICTYEFYAENDNKESVRGFIEAVDSSLSHREDKVIIFLGCYIPGGMQYVMRIRNYSDTSLEKADLPGAGSVDAMSPDISGSDLFRDPEIYTYFKDVRYFKIDDELKKTADEKGIDWYQVWDNLESFEIV